MVAKELGPKEYKGKTKNLGEKNPRSLLLETKNQFYKNKRKKQILKFFVDKTNQLGIEMGTEK